MPQMSGIPRKESSGAKGWCNQEAIYPSRPAWRPISLRNWPLIWPITCDVRDGVFHQEKSGKSEVNWPELDNCNLCNSWSCVRDWSFWKTDNCCASWCLHRIQGQGRTRQYIKPTSLEYSFTPLSSFNHQPLTHPHLQTSNSNQHIINSFIQHHQVLQSKSPTDIFQVNSHQVH